MTGQHEHMKTRGDIRCSGSVSISCSMSYQGIKRPHATISWLTDIISHSGH